MQKHTDNIIKLAKQYSNKKTVLAILSFILILGITILSSIPEFIIQPDQILTTKFATKLIMTVIIGVVSLVCFIFISSTSNGLNPISNICRAREAFRHSAKDIIENHYLAFKQWVIKVRRPAKQLEVDKRELRKVGITNLAYLELNECDLRNLMVAPDKELGERYGVRQITKEQFDVIMNIKKGKSTIKFLSVDDYLLEKTMGVDQTDEEILVNQFKKRNLMFGEKISSRVLILVVVAVTFGCIKWSVDKNLEGDMDTIQRTFTIIWDILSKLFTAVSSALIGYFDGGKFNDFDANYLQIKTNVHIQYLSDKEFKPLTEQELAREEFIKYHQKMEDANRNLLEFNNSETNK